MSEDADRKVGKLSKRGEIGVAFSAWNRDNPSVWHALISITWCSLRAATQRLPGARAATRRSVPSSFVSVGPASGTNDKVC